MHYGVVMSNLGAQADPRLAVGLVRAAEEAGWDGFFVWDHLGFVWGPPSCDPWVILSAAAVLTTRLKLGTAITPLARRRPHVVANALASLDLLSGGRVVFGVGIGGVAEEFTAFGEPGDAKERARMLDEGLTVLDGLWSGGSLTHHGQYYDVENVSLGPIPLQRPRIPIWVGGESAPALRRAARWDGWFAPATSPDGMARSPEHIAEMVAEIRRLRTVDTPLEVAVDGYSEPGDAGLPRAYEAAGATWWLESIHGMRGSPDEMMARVEAGPPERGGEDARDSRR